jgi:hypothetical protein
VVSFRGRKQGEKETSKRPPSSYQLRPFFHLIISIITTRSFIEEKKGQRNQRKIEGEKEK